MKFQKINFQEVQNELVQNELAQIEDRSPEIARFFLQVIGANSASQKSFPPFKKLFRLRLLGQ